MGRPSFEGEVGEVRGDQTAEGLPPMAVRTRAGLTVQNLMGFPLLRF